MLWSSGFWNSWLELVLEFLAGVDLGIPGLFQCLFPEEIVLVCHHLMEESHTDILEILPYGKSFLFYFPSLGSVSFLDILELLQVFDVGGSPRIPNPSRLSGILQELCAPVTEEAQECSWDSEGFLQSSVNIKLELLEEFLVPKLNAGIY